MRPGEVFVLWTPDVQDAFCRLSKREGSAKAARMLDMPERNLFDFRRGRSRGGGTVRPRKFLSVDTLARLAKALDEPELENREALPHREWSDRGEWPYFGGEQAGYRARNKSVA